MTKKFKIDRLWIWARALRVEQWTNGKRTTFDVIQRSSFGRGVLYCIQTGQRQNFQSVSVRRCGCRP